jgi:enoyl-CoA hydratase/carnithine racemase
MSEPLVLTQRDGPIGRITLNAPGQANVLSTAMMTALGEALDAFNADPEVRVIVLGAEGRIFCAGHDLAELRADNDIARHQALFDQCGELMLKIADGRVPVIARVQGAAVAAGCQLVAACDLAYAVKKAKFAVSGVNLGLFCSTPGVALGRAVSRKTAAEMLLTGRMIDADEALARGLINRAVEPEELDAVINEIAAEIAAKPPETIALGRAVFRRQMEQPLAEAYQIASAAMAENLSFDATRAGIDGFLKR